VQRAFKPIPLKQHDMLDPMLRQRQRLVHHRLVGNDARAFDAARGGQQHLGRGVVDALGQFERREAAEHHRMDRPSRAQASMANTVSGIIGM
jgi:hypothetical protein